MKYYRSDSVDPHVQRCRSTYLSSSRASILLFTSTSTLMSCMYVESGAPDELAIPQRLRTVTYVLNNSAMAPNSIQETRDD